MSEWRDRIRNEDLTVVVSDLLVATAESHDPMLDGAVTEVLASLRQRLGMDVVFVSEFVDGRRVFRFVDHSGPRAVIRPGGSNPVEETYCQRVVDGRLPELVRDVAKLPPSTDLPKTDVPIGGHLSTPIVLKSGETYGTLCTFSAAPKPELRDKDLDTLRMCAKLVALKLDTSPRPSFLDPPSQWALEPMPGDPPARPRR